MGGGGRCAGNVILPNQLEKAGGSCRVVLFGGGEIDVIPEIGPKRLAVCCRPIAPHSAQA